MSLPTPFYDEGGITIYCGDCREILPHIDIDSIVTDPPYGIGHVHSGKAKGKWHVANRAPIHMDDAPFDPAPYIRAKTVMFGADHYAPLLPPGGVFHVWDKECGRTGRFDTFSDAELFWTSFPGKRRVIRYMWKGLQVEHPGTDGRREHPTQKPVTVMSQVLSMVPNCTEVCDPFMGSGTTLVAAKLRGLRAVGIEINKDYCEAAVARLSQGVLLPC